jgi:UPF0716 protein FxsA
MCGPLFALLILIPVIELSLLIRIGSRIGVLSTVWLVALTAAVGLYFVRRQGLAVLRNLQTPGPDMTAQMLEGPLLALAAVCLLIPGFVTDSIGALLIIPPVRSAVARAWLARLSSGAQLGRGGGIQFTMHGFDEAQHSDPRRPASGASDDEETVVTITEKRPDQPAALPAPSEEITPEDDE